MLTNKTTLAGALVFLSTMYVFPDTGSASNFYQLEYARLMQPAPEQLAREAGGHVAIYDGMMERDVDLALDRQFPRIESMMFVRTAYVSETGEISQDDDCD